MLKKTMTYTDYNGNSITEDFYFNLTKAEALELELTTEGGFAERCEKIVNTVDVPSLIRQFKDIILRTYGEKSPDGKRFIKSEELSTAFSQTEAYSDLFMELATNADEAAKFINGVAPTDMKQNVQAKPAAVPNDVQNAVITPAT